MKKKRIRSWIIWINWLVWDEDLRAPSPHKADHLSQHCEASCIIENLSSWSDAKFSIKAFISAVARCGRWKLPNYTTVEINKTSEFNSMFTVLRLILYQILNWFGASSSCDRKEFLKLLIVEGKLVCSETVVRSCGDNFCSFSAHTCEARKTVSVNERNFNASTN